MATLEAKNLSLGYRRGSRVVRDVSLQVGQGEIVSLVGPNGSGKSTILRALARLMAPQAGAVYLNGKAIHTLPTKAVSQELAILPQNPSAPDDLTIRDLVARGRFARQSWWRTSTRADREVIDWSLAVTGLTSLSTRRMDSLSGGERQRAWIALALAQEPRMLLLDEPTTFLDISHQLEVMLLLQELNRMNRLSIVMVLHDLNQAARFSHRLIALQDGEIYAVGTPAAVMNESMLREVFRVEGVIGEDPYTHTPTFTPLQALHGGHTGGNGAAPDPDR